MKNSEFIGADKTVRPALKKEYPPVLDVCCGYRGMWFNKKDDRCMFQDIRSCDYSIPPNAAYPRGTVLQIRPDHVGNFTNMDFPDNTFRIVVMDPPHMRRKNPAEMLKIKYGVLEGDWKEMLQMGIDECFRVLLPGGVFIFKWCEYSIPLREILALTEHKPLFGHKSGKQSKTHWMCFMKQESPVLGEESPAQNTM